MRSAPYRKTEHYGISSTQQNTSSQTRRPLHRAPHLRNQETHHRRRLVKAPRHDPGDLPLHLLPGPHRRQRPRPRRPHPFRTRRTRQLVGQCQTNVKTLDHLGVPLRRRLRHSRRGKIRNNHRRGRLLRDGTREPLIGKIHHLRTPHKPRS